VVKVWWFVALSWLFSVRALALRRGYRPAGKFGHQLPSGKLTRSEINGFGEEEFQPWLQGATL
jgi:hypothetical protein